MIESEFTIESDFMIIYDKFDILLYYNPWYEAKAIFYFFFKLHEKHIGPGESYLS
jgi:hypothetical protein